MIYKKVSAIIAALGTLAVGVLPATASVVATNTVLLNACYR